MECPSCGQKNPADTIFCSNCGRALTAEPPCSSCGQLNPWGLKFCRRCGARLPATATPAPSITLPASTVPTSLAERAVHKAVNALDRLASGVFVGREREIDELRAGLEEALTGHGRLLLLVGEPGIGKTRTANELATYARLQGARVLMGRCYEGGGAPPFWPWVQIVRSYVHDRDPKVLTSEMGPGAADIAQVVLEVRERLPDLSPPPVLEPEQARFRFFDSLTTFLKNAGNRQPLVLILDDLHWADKPSLLLLQFVARELGDACLLVVGTYRDVELGRQHPLLETLAELARVQGSQRILLRGLTERAVARFIEITAGLKPPEALIAAVYKETEGNPFFVNEVVHLLVTDGCLDRPEEVASWSFGIPQGVREVIGRRLNNLSEECNRVLTLASVIGREFGLDALERVSDTTGDRLLEVLEEAVAAHVISEVPYTAGRYSFSHTLIRETLYEGLTTIRRVRLHRRIGEVLEGLYRTKLESHPSAGSGQALAELAYHFFEAAQGGGDVDKAIDYAVRAGERATALLAYEEAVSHYERALGALELKEPAEEGQRCELLLALGEAQARAGDFDKARETFRWAADIARKLGAQEQLARAALGFGGTRVVDRAGILDKLLVGLLEEALGALGKGESALRARLLARLAMALYWSDLQERRASLSQEAVEMARRVGDTAALAYALEARHFALWGPENVEERLAVATEIVQLAEKSRDRETALAGHWWRLVDLLELGDIAAADLEIEAYARLAEELRQPQYLWYTPMLRAMRALLEGRFEETEQPAQQALAAGQRGHDPNAVQNFAVQMFTLCREQGRLQEMEGAIKGFVEQYPAIPAWRSALAFLYSELGCEAEARAEFEHLAVNDFADLPRDFTWLIAVMLLSQVCAFLGDARRAATLYQLLLPYARRNVVVGTAAACYGSASGYLGLLAATMARWQEAAQHFEDALKMSTKMKARPFVAYTQYEYTAMLLARGQPGDPSTGSGPDRERALELLDLALDTAQELGMKSLAEKAMSLKLQIRGRASGETAVSIAPGTSAAEAKQPVLRHAQHERLLSGVSRTGPVTLSPSKGDHRPAVDNVFRNEGEYWTLAYQGTVCRFKNSKGLHYIAFLLRHPGEEFRAVELAEHNLSVAGPGGRDRKAASAAERARLNVTKSIKAALSKISENHPALGYHLTTSIKTGIFCSYTPDPTHPISWTL